MGLEDVLKGFVEAISGARGPVPAIVAGIVSLFLTGVLLSALGLGTMLGWLFLGAILLLLLGLGGSAVAALMRR